MSNLTPIVSPPNNGLGTSVGILPTAIFEKSMEKGSVNTSSCFLVEIERKDDQSWDDILNSANFISNIVDADVSSQKINLADENEYTGVDYGNDIDSGEQYRTKIIIDPVNTLKPNTNYAGLLSKDLTPITVFDSEANGGNSGNGKIDIKGPHTSLIEDEYIITITHPGTANTAKYGWFRVSDSASSGVIEARGRYTEIGQELRIKFLDGSFVAGDSYTVKIIPADYQAEIFSWNFSTGSGEYQEPDDERSGSLIDLPVSGGSSASIDSLQIVSIDPPNAATLVPIARKSGVTVGLIVYITKEYTSSYNSFTVEYLAGGTAGSETVDVIDTTKIQITIEDGVSTAQQVVDVFNADALGADIEASTESGTATQAIQEAKKFSEGVDANTITITFNKDLNASTVTDDRIKVLTRAIYPVGQSSSVPFTYQVSGKQLVITLQEE